MSDDPDDLSEEADKLLVALVAASNDEGMVSARQDRSNTLVSKGPDVLWTPKGGGKKEVSYSVIAYMDKSKRLSTSVRNNGNYDFQLNSRTIDIEGHEPGTEKGIVVPGYKRFSHAEIGADYLFSEGFANVSHRDPAWINRDEEGPTEPRRNITEEFVAYVPNSTSTEPPQRTAESLVFDPTPIGQPQTFGALTPGQEMDRLNTLMRNVHQFLERRTRVRDGGSPDRSTFQRNAQGEANVDSTSRPFSQRLMSDLIKNQKLSVDDAAGFAGNAGTESANFTQFHETIAATYVKDAAGNYVLDANGRRIVKTPQHLATAREGGRGAIQWTATRREEFKKLIAGREKKAYDRNQDFPEGAYSDYGNNEAMIEHDLNGNYSDTADTLRQGTSSVPDWAHNMKVPSSQYPGGKSFPSTADATWRVFSTYEKPADYGNWDRNPNAANTRKVQANFKSRLKNAVRYLEEYRKGLQRDSAKKGGTGG